MVRNPAYSECDEEVESKHDWKADCGCRKREEIPMFGLIIGIIGLIAAGALVAYAIVLTFRWLKSKIKEKLAAKNAKKVAVADLEELIESCDNTVTVDQLEELSDEGYTHLMATVDESGKVSDVEVIRDTSDSIDDEVDQFINRTGEGMVVVTG